MNLRGPVWLYSIAAFAIAGALAPRPAVAQTGCCVCTECAAPALFACREALGEPECQTACTNLGCSAHQFNVGTECVDTPQCYGDCCDAADGACGQAQQGDCTGGSVFFANSFCDGSNCLAAPPTATVTATAPSTATLSATPTTTVTATPSHSHTAEPTATASATASHSGTPSATATQVPPATATASLTATASSTATASATATHSATATSSATASSTSTQTPSTSPTPSVTPMSRQFTWLLNDRTRLDRIFSLRAGSTFDFPYGGRRPSLDLEDSEDRFCTAPGLIPRVRLDLDPADCENQCTIGIFPQDSTSVTHIARLPALYRAGGTFDVLIDTVLGCEDGEPPTQLRMPAAVTYVRCLGDCNGDSAVSVEELVLAVGIAVGRSDTSDCLVTDRDGGGTIQIDELIAAVNVALQGCGDD